MPANPICVALDTPDLDHAVALAKALKPHVGWAKVGMEFFYAHGLAGYARVAETGLPIFLDLKLHDISATVAAAVKSAVALDVRYLTVHASGGPGMLAAAAAAAATSGPSAVAPTAALTAAVSGRPSAKRQRADPAGERHVERRRSEGHWVRWRLAARTDCGLLACSTW